MLIKIQRLVALLAMISTAINFFETLWRHYHNTKRAINKKRGKTQLGFSSTERNKGKRK